MQKIKNHFHLWKMTYLLTMLVLAIGGAVYFTGYANAEGEYQSFIGNVVLTDADTTGYGLDGRDFRVTWTPSSTVPTGYQMTQVFITTSGLQLVTSTLFTNGCNGSPCQSWGGFNQFSMATHTLPQFMKEDSTRTALATSSDYVAWVYVQATSPFIVSSTALSYAEGKFDAVVSDVSAPQIMHLSAHGTTESAAATLYANVFDDQTLSENFANPADGGAEYFRLYYTQNSEAWNSANSSTAVIVSGAGELYSFTIPTSSVPAAGQTVKYYLVAQDRATSTPNVRYFCATQNATSTAACQSSPFIMNTVAAGGRSVSGKVTSEGSNLIGATVFVGGFALPAVTTDGSGDYTISGLPSNDVIDITATKGGYAMAQRHETIGSTDKTGINLNVNRGGMGFYEGGDDGGGSAGGAPRVVFSGPPEGMQGFPLNESLRVGFSQPLDASTITTVSSATSSNVYLVKSMTGENVPGTVSYCANNVQTGCSELFSMDSNVILFNPTSDLATSTQYTLMVTGAVKSQGGQAVQGNRPEGGHKINFSTMGSQISDFGAIFTGGQYGNSGMYMPPYVRSMSPSPGITAAPNAGILLEFNEAMSASTINDTNINLVKIGGSAQSITVSLDSNEKRFLTISHSALEAGEYEVRVKGAVANASGLLMRGDNSASVAFSSRFLVAGSSDSTAPTIYPALTNNSTGVATNKIFEFGFNEQLAVSTINSTNILMYQGATAQSVAVNYDAGKNSVYVAPANVLTPNTVYAITFNATVTDLAGNGMVTTTYTYTTGAMDTAAPKLTEARCDDYRCYVKFSEPMNHDSFSDSHWVSSTINLDNWTLNSGGVVSLTGKSISYDPVDNSIKIEGLTLTAGANFTITANAGVTDISENTISGSNRSFSGKVEDSKNTFGSFGEMGMFGPPTGDFMGGDDMIGQGEFKPQGFGNFTADQFGMGQADMAYPFNPMAGGDSNVFQVRFTPNVVVATGDQIVLTFPNGTNVSSVTADTQSPFYTDFNQFMAGTITGSVSDDNDTKVTVTLTVSGSPNSSDPLTIDLRKIVNPAIPKGPQTGGYTVGINLVRSGAVLANKTSMPYYIMAGGSNTLVVDVVAGTNTSTPTAGADGTVYLHGGGPGGPMDKVLTLVDGEITTVDGSAGTSITYNNLPDGCYGVGTEPYITLGGNDFYGQMSPEPVCLNGGVTTTKWMLLTPANSVASGAVTTTVKFVDSNGDPYDFGGKNIDIFAGGPGKFVVKTLDNVGVAATNGYAIKLNANGIWNIGMGPAMPKGAAGGKPTSLGVMPPSPIQLNVADLPGSGTVSLGMSMTPPNVAFNNTNDTVTFTFASSSGYKTVTGTVKDASGSGLANVEVFMHRQGFGMPLFTETNASGTFSIGVPEFGNYEIGAHKDGLPEIIKNVEVKSLSGTKLYVDGKDVTSNFVLGMKKADYTISGKVLDSSSNGIAYAPVMAVNTNGTSVFGQTSADGSYTLFVDNGTWTVRAELPSSKTDTCGTFSKTVTVSGSSQASQNITPSSATCVTLSGSVSVGGTALANVPIFIEEWSSGPVAGGLRKGASTDSNGAYSVKVLGNKTYRIGTMSPDYGELSATKAILGVSAEQNITLTTSTATFSFTGGTADMDAFIELKNAADQMKRIGKQQNGLNTSASLIVASGATYNYFVDVFGVGKFTGTIVAGASEAINLGLTGSGYITVTGTIYDALGDEKSGTLVTFTNASTTVTVVADENGQYTANLKAGTYDVSDSLSNYIPTKETGVSFTTNTAGYDFGTTEGGTDPNGQAPVVIAPYTIEGTVSSSAGATLSEGFVWAENASGTVITAQIDATDGSYTLPVSIGDWTIHGVGPLHEDTTTTVTVDGNETKNFQLAADSDNVPTSTTGIIAADVGGSINDTSASGIKITAGQGVLETTSGDVTLNLEKNYTAPDTENYSALGNASFGISASGDSTIKKLTGNAEIVLDYSSLLASLPAGVSESQLQLAYYSPERDEYVPVEGGFTVDPANNTITGQVDHFTDFVITYRNNDAGITVTEAGGSTAVTEGGATDSITYVLTSQPTANVVITPSASGSKVSLSPTTLTFTSVNWATPQTLTVTAVDDSSVEGTHTDTITHAISSADANYAGVSISNITVTVTDNDSAGGGGSSGSPVADTTPPTNTSVVIAGGATSTSNINVNLTLGAIDASQMTISNTSTFAGATWEVYATTKANWNLLAGAGVKTVYAKFRDSAGNISTAVSDTIELLASYNTSTPAPVLPVVVEEPRVVICPLAVEKAYRHKDARAIFYVTEDCTRRPFNKSNVFFTYFDSWNDVVVLDTMDKLNQIPNDKLGFMPWGHKYDPKYGALVKIVSDPRVYLLLGDKKYWITSEEVFNTLKYSWNWIEDISTKLLDKYSTGGEITNTSAHPNYTLIKYNNSAKVYRLEPDPKDATRQVKRHVKDEVAFNALNFRWDRIVTIDDSEKYTDGEVLSSAQAEKLTKDLSFDMSDPEVKVLQQKLKIFGYFTYEYITEYFGKVTENAVKAYEKANGLAVDGKVDIKVRELLNKN